jgi:pimeloyl-ACP methyl ester carboxylesterase
MRLPGVQAALRPTRASGAGAATLRRGALLLGLTLLGAACATPVGVTPVNTQTAYRLLTANVVSAGRASEASQRVLRRYGLEDLFEKKPADALATLHQAFVRQGGEDRLVALAELSFLHAEEHRDRAYYLAAAVYAYALLFPDAERTVALDPVERRYRLVYDLYNLGLAQGLRRDEGDEVDLTPGRRSLPFGSLDIGVEDRDFTWLGYRLDHFVPAASLAVRGLRNRYVQPGVGAALVAGLARQEAVASVPGARRIGPGTRLPVTVFLRLEDPRGSLASGEVKGRLELYPQDRATTVSVDGHEQPLESDPTAALALWLEHSPLWDAEMRGLFQLGILEWIPRDRADDGLFLLEPYRAERIPIILVHGTYSSPARWAELVNELRGDPRIRERYQIWLFAYDTGYPIGYSAGRLRRALERTLSELDPAGTVPALRRMVIIGHSQGGLLAKLTVVDSGDRFWRNVSDVPLDSVDVDAKVREIVRQSVFFTPESFVERVIFVATPHQGSYLAGPRLAGIFSWLLGLPVRLTRRTFAALTQNEEAQLRRLIERLPTSIDNMSPTNRFIETLAPIPIAPGVHVNSIVAVEGDGPYQDGSDGVVRYRSAHLLGAESELVVRSGHSVQSNPEAIEEIRRILLEHGGLR